MGNLKLFIKALADGVEELENSSYSYAQVQRNEKLRDLLKQLENGLNLNDCLPNLNAYPSDQAVQMLKSAISEQPLTTEIKGKLFVLLIP